jgi:hypothetical protein
MLPKLQRNVTRMQVRLHINEPDAVGLRGENDVGTPVLQSHRLTIQQQVVGKHLDDNAPRLDDA